VASFLAQGTGKASLQQLPAARRFLLQASSTRRRRTASLSRKRTTRALTYTTKGQLVFRRCKTKICPFPKASLVDKADDLCSDNACSSINGYMSYYCYTDSCDGSFTGAGSDSGGTCDFFYTPQTCSDVNAVCSSNYCYTYSYGIYYNCYDPFCSGSYFTSSGGSGSSGSASRVEDCGNVTITSCDNAASAFADAGCSCYTCSKTGGYLSASCSSPFTCSLSSQSYFYDDTALDDIADYSSMAALVYGIAAALLVGFAGLGKCIVVLCFRKVEKEASTKDLVLQAMPPVSRFVCKCSFASIIQEDGSRMGFVDYLCDKKELFGLLDCRKKTAAVRPRWMRFFAAASALMVTISLAFILGTGVYNNEDCSTSQQVDYCADSADSSPTSVTAVDCQAASAEASNTANWVTTAITLASSSLGSMVIRSAEDGSRLQIFFLLLCTAMALGLMIYGIALASALSKVAAEGDDGANSRQVEAIGMTLLTGWGYDQLVGIAGMILNFLFDAVMYKANCKPRLEGVKGAGAAVVHPHSAPQDLDDSIMKTEAVKGGVGYPVRIDKVKLEVLMPQQ